jgi:hypothetical protein
LRAAIAAEIRLDAIKPNAVKTSAGLVEYVINIVERTRPNAHFAMRDETFRVAGRKPLE